MYCGICVCASVVLPPPGMLEGDLARQTQSFLFSVSRGSGTGENQSGRGWVGKRPSPSCPSWLRFPAKVRCPRHSPRGPGRDAWPWDGRLRGRMLDHVQPPGTWSQGPALAAPEQAGGVVLELRSVPTAAFLPPPESPGRPPPSTSGLSWWA